VPDSYKDFSERFPGLEFDWFALDAEGNIGLFSSAGFGPVPANVQLHFLGHDQAASQIDWRVPEVWKECASHGLFVFDWQHWNGPYLKVEQPTSEIEAAFKHQILQIPGLPVFKVTFGAVESIFVEEDKEF
jgi:hypothetical protein